MQGYEGVTLGNSAERGRQTLYYQEGVMPPGSQGICDWLFWIFWVLAEYLNATQGWAGPAFCPFGKDDCLARGLSLQEQNMEENLWWLGH